MKNYLGRVILLVDDYEKASQFYEENFGFVRLFDVTTDVGQRFLHIGSEPLDSLGIWFLKAEGKEQKARIGNQTAGQPTLVIYTTDLDQQYAKMKSNGVKIKVEPVKTPEYSFFHCYDSMGNELIVTELKD